MSYGCFINKNDAPTEQGVQKALGTKMKTWREIVDYLAIGKKTTAKFKFYGVNYGWALGFTKNGRSILALYPDKNDFCVQFILNEKQEAALLREIENTELRDMIEKKKSIREGKWIFARIGVFKGVEEVKRIVEIRMNV
jgi:hypothetical protein